MLASIHHWVRVTVLIIITLTFNAQVNGFRIGVQGGPSVSKLRGNDFLEEWHSSMLGTNVGLSIEYFGKRHFGLKTGVYYENKGSMLHAEMTDINGQSIGTLHVRTDFNYITMPLDFRYYFGKRIQMYINAGAFVGYLTRANVHEYGLKVYPEINRQITMDYLSFDWGLSTGIGASMRVSPRYSISMECNHHLGLRNISRWPVYKNQSIKTNVLNINIGLHYHLLMKPKTQNKNTE